MKRLLLSLLLASLTASIVSCSKSSPASSSSSEEGSAKISVRVGKVGATRAALPEIELQKLYIMLSASGETDIKDSFDLSGNNQISSNGSYSGLAALKEWTLNAYTKDVTGKTIHMGSKTFTVQPRETSNVSLSLAAQFSMLRANFFPIRQNVERCELWVDGVKEDDSSFTKNTLLGDTVQLGTNYISASEEGISHNFTMAVYGDDYGVEDTLYYVDTTVMVQSGVDANYQLKLKYVGPDSIASGALDMVVVMGNIGTVILDGELEKNVDVTNMLLFSTAYSAPRTGGGVFAINADGSDRTLILDEYVYYPSWSPDKSRILYTKGTLGTTQIWVMDSDGKNQQQLTNQVDGVSNRAVWSPDGSKVCFINGGGEDKGIYRVNADGSNIVSLTTDGTSPIWSPDGSKILFLSSRDGSTEVYVMNADGSNQTRLTNNSFEEQHPSWSPDGNKILLGVTTGQVYVMNTDGSNLVMLADSSSSYYPEPQWSPDGTKIAYISSVEKYKEAVYIMNADGSSRAKLAEPEVDPMYQDIREVSGITWSSDGSKIAFHGIYPVTVGSLYTVHIDGANTVRLTQRSDENVMVSDW